MSESREYEKRQGGCCQKRNDHKLQPAADNLSESTVDTRNTGVSPGHTIAKSQDNSTAGSGHNNINSASLSHQLTGDAVTAEESEQVLVKTDQATNPLDQVTKSSQSGCQCANMSKVRKVQLANRNVAQKANHKDSTYAGMRSSDGVALRCVQCEKGHRGSTCTHHDRPVVEAKRPGRPKNLDGRKRAKVPGRHKNCDCPKTCKCVTDCDCKQECFCVIEAFLAAYIHGPTELPGQAPTFKEGMTGYFKKEQKVWTDWKGNVLTDEQKRERETKKAELLERERNQTGLLTPPTPGLMVQTMSPAAFTAQDPFPQYAGGLYADTLSAQFQPLATPSQQLLDNTTDIMGTNQEDVFTGINQWPQNNITAPVGFNHSSPGSFLPSPGLSMDWDPTTHSSQFWQASTVIPQDPLSYTNQVLPQDYYPVNQNAIVQNQMPPENPACTCTGECACIFCLQHPHNYETRGYVRSVLNNVNQNIPMDFEYYTGTGSSSNTCSGRSELAVIPNCSFLGATHQALEHAPATVNMTIMYGMDREPQVYRRNAQQNWVVQQSFEQPFQQPLREVPELPDLQYPDPVVSGAQLADLTDPDLDPMISGAQLVDLADADFSEFLNW